MRRRHAIAFAAGTALLGLGLTVYFLLRSSLPALDGRRPVAGLEATVVVERDGLGVPTLRGTQRDDVFRALGYVHAQDRFFQMDLLRRAAAGELAALLGEGVLSVDRQRRIHRMRRTAGQVLQRLPPGQRRVLTAYTEGVNAGLADLRLRPFEYLLLRQAPRSWRSEDSILVIFALWFDLQDEDAERDARRAVMEAALPGPVIDFLLPTGTEWDAPLFGAAAEVPPIPPAAVYDLRRRDPKAFPVVALGRPAAMEAEVGSNAWAVDGRYTADGAAWLANDMHLGLGVPTTWYRVRLVLEGQEGFDAVGVSLPGAPGLVAGSNRRVAWGFTNSYGDWSDRIRLALHPQDPQRYLTPDGYFQMEEGIELLEVRGSSPASLSVRSTRWGPVVADAAGRPEAIRWLAHQPEATDLGLLDLLYATDAAQALRIAQRAGLPPQNLIVADRHGEIGWTLAGRLPRRGAMDGRRPLPWTEGDWAGWLDPEEYPQLLRPRRGRLWTANARTLDAGRLPLLGDGGYALGMRARQIRDGLLAHDRHSPESFLGLQLNDRALLMERWHAQLLAVLERAEPTPQRRAAREVLLEWEGRAAAGSVAYRILAEWREAVHEAVFAALTLPVRDRNPAFRFEGFPQTEGPLWALVTAQPAHLLNPRYPTWDAFLLAVLDAQLQHYAGLPGGLRARSWGERNRLQMQHPLSRALPSLSRWLDMPSAPMPGDRHVPRVQAPRFGASERLVVSPGQEARGYFHMPGGQSGHPLSPYYRAGHEAWVRGAATPLLPGEPEHRLFLQPRAAAEG